MTFYINDYIATYQNKQTFCLGGANFRCVVMVNCSHIKRLFFAISQARFFDRACVNIKGRRAVFRVSPGLARHHVFLLYF